MNVLILNWRDPKHPLAGGAEQMVYEHAKYWYQKGAAITWFSSSFKNCKTEENLNGIKIIRRGNHFTVSLWCFIFYLLGKFKNISLVVDCFHFFPYFSRFYFINTPKIGLIQEVAGKLWFKNLPYPLASIGYLLEKPILRSYKDINFITGSNSAKNDLIKLGLKNKRINVINHGINKINFKKSNKEVNPTLIFLGRISKDKGIEDAIKTLKILNYINNKFTLWIVGKSESKEYEYKIKKKIKKYNLQKNCKFFGFVSQKEKFELLNKAWIIIHPSLKEGWGLNIIEANYAGTPAVGYNVPGLVDSIVNNKTGFLTDADPESLAKGILRMIDRKELYNTMTLNSKKWAEKFEWTKSSISSYKLILSVISNYENK